MLETVTSGSSRSLWARAPDVGRRPVAEGSGAALPMVQSGQLWLLQLRSTEPTLSPLEYRILTTVNVVIYDRALASVVAGFLPLGGYAEPAASSEEASDPGWERCLRFARDGWSVARLAAPRGLSTRLLTAAAPGDLTVAVFVNTGGGAYERTDMPLAELGDIVDRHEGEPSPALTILFGATNPDAGPNLSVAAANGLAG